MNNFISVNLQQGPKVAAYSSYATKMSFVNIRSIRGKMREIQEYISTQNIGLSAKCETWLPPTTTVEELHEIPSPGYWFIHNLGPQDLAVVFI